MNYTRTFLDSPFVRGEIICLEKKNYHHEINVLRKKIEDRFIAFDGQGNSCLVELVKFNKKTFELLVVDIFTKSKREGLEIDLGQSLIKNDPFNLAIQKATELGVKHFSPLMTERVIVSRKSINWKNRKEKWVQTARGACEQCGENWMPKIKEPQSVQDWSKLTSSETKIVLYPGATSKLSDIKIKESVSIAIGPEGDFTKKEVRALKEEGFIPVTIGRRILRAETAAISVVSALRYSAKEF